MAECVRLESGYAARHREFESRPLRRKENKLSGEQTYLPVGRYVERHREFELRPKNTASMFFYRRDPSVRQKTKTKERIIIALLFWSLRGIHF